FQAAVDLALLSAGELYVLHTIEAQPFVSDLFGIDEMGERALDLETRATGALEKLVESSAGALAGLSLITEVTAGRASVEIVKHARAWRTDLIVLGAKGATALEQIVMGSTAEH